MILKLWPSLQATLTEVRRTDLLLDHSRIELLQDVVNQLEPFYDLTNMLCSNTSFAFNHYLPMKKDLYAELKKDVEISDPSNTTVMGAFRNKLFE